MRYDYFLFFDTPEHLADQLFIKQMVRVWFDQEYAKEGSPFLAILCHVKKKDSAKFLAALDALKNKIDPLRLSGVRSGSSKDDASFGRSERRCTYQ